MKLQKSILSIYNLYFLSLNLISVLPSPIAASQYLHCGCHKRIIHRDIKASNILLSPDYEGQISDFGLAKWLLEKWAHHVVYPIEGTFGYLAPEYFMHGVVNEKTDVFAFGVLLLENGDHNWQACN
ncbi:unnamed protein product [Rhodiola kirilowii]